MLLTNLLQEHQLQLETFDATVESLFKASSPSDNYTAKHRLGAIQREIKRLRAHLPIYARREDLLQQISSTRVVILKADTGSGKSTQLVQYLIDGGFTERGTLRFLQLIDWCLELCSFLRTNCLYPTSSIGSTNPRQPCCRRIRLRGWRWGSVRQYWCWPLFMISPADLDRFSRWWCTSTGIQFDESAFCHR